MHRFFSCKIYLLEWIVSFYQDVTHTCEAKKKKTSINKRSFSKYCTPQLIDMFPDTDHGSM